VSRPERQAIELPSDQESPSWRQARELVLLFCHRLLAEHLVAYTAGNISMRIDDDPDLVAVTPASTAYDTMRLQDIVIVRTDGRIVHGSRKPTSELPLHTIAYLQRPDVRGVVHTHSPAAMAMAAMGRDLPPILHGIVSSCGGGVVAAPYARGGTAEVAEVTADALRDRSACLLRNHGVLAIGPTVEHAYNAASVVEGACDAYLRAAAFGPVPELPPDEIERIRRTQWEPVWRGRTGEPSHGG
jgi:L-fuculose-phosphate aldolase